MTFQTRKDIPHMGFGLLHDLMNYVIQPPASVLVTVAGSIIFVFLFLFWCFSTDSWKPELTLRLWHRRTTIYWYDTGKLF